MTMVKSLMIFVFDLVSLRLDALSPYELIESRYTENYKKLS
jgi:hypothetical protein